VKGLSLSADRPISTTGAQYHIRCKAGDLAPYLLVPGAPERAEKIAARWDEAWEVANHREFRSYTGRYRGVGLSVLSSGIGPSSIAITVHETASVGVDTLIRVGSTGVIREGIECGDLVISQAAVRLDGASNAYIMPGYPAVADYEVLLALIEAAENLGTRYHVGITATTSDFYSGQRRPLPDGSVLSKSRIVYEELMRGNVLNFEMEAATLFTLSSLLRVRAGAICAVYANRLTKRFEAGAGEDEAIKVANEAVILLSEWGQQKQRKSKRHFYPSLLGPESQ
jgi:uridine phosphorylase